MKNQDFDVYVLANFAVDLDEIYAKSISYKKQSRVRTLLT